MGLVLVGFREVPPVDGSKICVLLFSVMRYPSIPPILRQRIALLPTSTLDEAGGVCSEPKRKTGNNSHEGQHPEHGPPDVSEDITSIC